MTELVNEKIKSTLISLSPKAYLNTFIFDDIKNFDIDKVGKTIIDWGFKEYDRGERKRSFIYKA